MRKLDESAFSEQGLYEDILTSDVFGAFKYLPSDYLNAWIAKLRDRHLLLKPAFKLARARPQSIKPPYTHKAYKGGATLIFEEDSTAVQSLGSVQTESDIEELAKRVAESVGAQS